MRITMENIILFKNRAQEQELLENCIKQQSKNKSHLKILEAGCGRRWVINIDHINYTLTGVDIDKKALEFRKTEIKDLDEVIFGDLRTVDIKENSFDVIYNSFVLEHIQNAELALNNIFKWLKPGGILILRIPDRNSVYGFMTRITPFWFHVFFAKYIERINNAGTPGHGPYPTYHEKIVSRIGIHQYCKNNGYAIKNEFGQGHYLNKKRAFKNVIKVFVILVSFFSLGALKSEYNNVTYLIEKI